MSHKMGSPRSSLVLVSAIWLLIAIDVAELSCGGFLWNDQALKLECICERKEDVRAAAQCSNAAYDDSLKVNDTIPGTKWKIDAIIGRYTVRVEFAGQFGPFEPYLWVFRKPDLAAIYNDTVVKAIIARPVDPNDNAIMLCFRGTVPGNGQLKDQIMSSFKTLQTVDKNVKEQYGYQKRKPFKVMRYFWDVLKIVDEKLFKIFRDIWYNETNGLKKRYIVTGHSLGGALAQLFTLRLKIESADIMYNDKSRLITFGSPRVGDAAFASQHDREIFRGQKMRFIHESDVVAHIPPKPGVSDHLLMRIGAKLPAKINLVGKTIQAAMKMYDKFVASPPNYQHANTQVWIHNERLRVCSGKENDGERSCSNRDSVTARGLKLQGIMPTGLLDHDMENYSKKIDQLLKEECKPF